MPKACELRKGSIVDMDGMPHIVEQLQVQTPSARGSASLYKVRFRNLTNKQKLDKTFKGDDPLKDMDFEKRDIQFLYSQGDVFEFMDLEDYSQFSLQREDIEDEAQYLVDGMEGLFSLLSDGKVLGIELPAVVELKIEECDPCLRGASVTGRNKPAKLTTGLTVSVPEYMEPGEVIKVDTRTAKFVSRA